MGGADRLFLKLGTRLSRNGSEDSTRNSGNGKTPMPVEHPQPTNSTVYKLYASSQRCAFPGCAEPHIEVDANTGVKVCNSEVCHICARRENGPRWDASQTAEVNRSDSNLVLLCRKHHAFVDDRRNEGFYTPEVLKAWKVEQEALEGKPLTQDDIDAIAQTNVFITAEILNLGGQGGTAPGSGGGGRSSNRFQRKRWSWR